MSTADGEVAECRRDPPANGIPVHDGFAIAAANLLVWSHALHVITALQRAGIDVLVLKGLPQLEELYGDVGARLSFDIDLLVRSVDLPAAVDVLERAGARARSPILHTLLKADAPACRTVGSYTWLFDLADGSILLDLHADGLYRGTKPFLDPRVWGRATARVLDGVRFLVLSPEDRLLQLACDYVVDGSPERGLRDLQQAVQKGNINWSDARTRAQQTGLTVVVYVALVDLENTETRPADCQLIRLFPIPGWRKKLLTRIRTPGSSHVVAGTPVFALVLSRRPLLRLIRRMVAPTRLEIACRTGTWPARVDYLAAWGTVQRPNLAALRRSARAVCTMWRSRSGSSLNEE